MPAAVVTDSVSDLTADMAAGLGVRTVPLLVSFGERQYRSGVDMTTEEFWEKLTAPGAPFPQTAAAGAGVFRATFQEAFDAGADSIVYLGVGRKLSATLESARIAAEMLAGREIHLIDTETASMGEGLLVELAAEMASDGVRGSEIAERVRARVRDSKLYFALETLEYLRRGGRISGARAALGTLLAVKPILTITDGEVAAADRVRTRSKARERLIELLTARPIERMAVIHAVAPDAEAFADELSRAAGVDRARVPVVLIGPTVGPHVGPGAYGAAVVHQA